MTPARELATLNTCPAAGLATRCARDQRAALRAARARQLPAAHSRARSALPPPTRCRVNRRTASVDAAAEGDSFDREAPRARQRPHVAVNSGVLSPLAAEACHPTARG